LFFESWAARVLILPMKARVAKSENVAPPAGRLNAMRARRNGSAGIPAEIKSSPVAIIPHVTLAPTGTTPWRSAEPRTGRPAFQRDPSRASGEIRAGTGRSTSLRPSEDALRFVPPRSPGLPSDGEEQPSGGGPPPPLYLFPALDAQGFLKGHGPGRGYGGVSRPNGADRWISAGLPPPVGRRRAAIQLLMRVR